MSTSEQNRFSIIVAGGSGTRMRSVIAKQFLPLFDKPILSHTIEKFLSIPENKVIAVLPLDDMNFWEDIIESNEILTEAVETGKLKTVVGGATRYQSVSNGLAAISENEGLVAIHDGVRPLITIELIENSFKEASQNGSAVLAVELKDSAREINGQKNHQIDRSKIRLVQTPQTFDLNKIKAAFALGEQSNFTDDASVFEYAGQSVNLIDGDYRNIKITTPEDLEIAEVFMKSMK
ncbi:2-C-methyl-D-erythritol 4-phosphate cytidylyltransferase [Jiulongibacter sediminis]|uniref:2-C-methyl-D-erythritol 4-phosphate cytidylyltransferase n=1 Tax=Jiulongibacter sediminis TaxID=1605367 RepID=UPI0026ED3DB2|nr:2-C-methyl-D-erythritol 4-phosphate cytidylyltransferase [Jiulongibacter sediminis]